MYDKISIGIDQSYTRTGISVAVDGKLKLVTSIEFKNCKCNTDKREKIKKALMGLIEKLQKRTNKLIIICERIRLFSQGFINQSYLSSTGALIATIVDTAHIYGVDVFSVDTRSWKSQVIGSSKSEACDKKLETIKFVKTLGFDVGHRNKNGMIQFDDDASDSACIALYAFIPETNQKLKLEK